MTFRLLLSHMMNGLATLVIVFALFVALANVGLISRPSPQNVFFGG